MTKFRASAAELAELERRATAVGVSVARYVAAAALEQRETASELRLWAAEVGRAKRIMWKAAEGIKALLAAGGAGGGWARRWPRSWRRCERPRRRW